MIKACSWSAAALLLLLQPFAIRADAYAKGLLHIEGGYRYGRTIPDSVVVNEWWFGKNRMAFSSVGWRFEWGGNRDVRFIWDKDKKRLLAIDLSQRSYVEGSLPWNLVSSVDGDTAAWLDQFLIDGRVEKTGRSVNLLDHACEEYHITEWMIRKDDRFFDRVRTVMVARDVPFDWRMADELYRWVASFTHPQPRYVSELKKMAGFILTSRESMFEGEARSSSLSKCKK